MSRDSSALIELTGLRFGFVSRPEFLGPLDLTMRRGEFWAIVGPNGAGKSTLLRLMAGLLAPHAGSICMKGRPLGDITARDRSKIIAFLPQHPPTDLDFSVRDVVLMGRFPHRSLSLFESAQDYCVADRAMQTTEVGDFASRSVATLSGGEAQRVHLAAALAQEPELLLLDEPTSSLDLRHQMTVLNLLRDCATSAGLGVIAVLHDVNLALQFCSHVLVLDDGRQVATGPPDEVLTPEVLEPVYGVTMQSFRLPGGSRRPWVAVMPDDVVSES